MSARNDAQEWNCVTELANSESIGERTISFTAFLDMSPQEAPFDASTFSKNRERLTREEVALKCFDAVVREARRLKLLSDEYFSVDGTLIEAGASMKSNQRKDGGGSGPGAGGDRDFKGERRSNATHASTTDPESKLLRKGPGKEAKLCHAGHALMDNRNGLMSGVAPTPAVGISSVAIGTASKGPFGLIPNQTRADPPVRG